MKFTIAGSIGNIGRPLIERLVADGHELTVISSQLDRKAEIESLGAKAAIGSVNDDTFLTRVFKGADAVYTMTPPNMGGSNVTQNTTNAGKAFAKAINASGVNRVVMLSSIGADLPAGNGPIAGLYNVEKIYDQLKDVSVTFIRAGYFYNNFYNDKPMIANMHIMGGNFPANTVLPLAHPADIANTVADELVSTSSGKNVQYVVSDLKNAGEIASALGTAIGNPQLPWVEFSDEQSLQGMLHAGLPEEIAGLYVEMGAGLRNGSIAADFLKGHLISGKIKLDDFAKEFASKF